MRDYSNITKCLEKVGGRCSVPLGALTKFIFRAIVVRRNTASIEVHRVEGSKNL